MTDDDGLDQIFLIDGQRSSLGQYFIYPSHRVKLENFFDYLLFCFIWTSLKLTLITFLKSSIKLKKDIIVLRASVRFENGPHAKNR